MGEHPLAAALKDAGAIAILLVCLFFILCGFITNGVNL